MLGKKVVIFISSASIKEAIKVASAVNVKDRVTIIFASTKVKDKIYQKFFIRCNDSVSQSLIEFNQDVVEQMSEHNMNPGRYLICKDNEEEWQDHTTEFEGILEYDIPVEVSKTLQSMADIAVSFVMSIQEDYYPFVHVAKEGKDYVMENDLLHYMDANGKLIDRYATTEEAMHNICYDGAGNYYDNGESNRPGTDTERIIKKDSKGNQYIVIEKKECLEQKGKKNKENDEGNVYVSNVRVNMGKDGRFSILRNIKLQIQCEKPKMNIMHAVFPEVKRPDIHQSVGLDRCRISVNAGALAERTKLISTAFICSDDAWKNYCVRPGVRDDGSCYLVVQAVHAQGYAVGNAYIDVEKCTDNYSEFLADLDGNFADIPIPQNFLETILTLVKPEDNILFTMMRRNKEVVLVDIKADSAQFTFSVNKQLCKIVDVSKFQTIYENYTRYIEFSNSDSLLKIIRIGLAMASTTSLNIMATHDSIKMKIGESEVVCNVGEEISKVGIEEGMDSCSISINPLFFSGILRNNMEKGKIAIRFNSQMPIIVVGEGKKYQLAIALFNDYANNG